MVGQGIEATSTKSLFKKAGVLYTYNIHFWIYLLLQKCSIVRQRSLHAVSARSLGFDPCSPPTRCPRHLPLIVSHDVHQTVLASRHGPEAEAADQHNAAGMHDWPHTQHQGQHRDCSHWIWQAAGSGLVAAAVDS